MLFLQMAQFYTATFHDHSATAFHCFTSMRLSISILQELIHPQMLV